MVTFISLCYVCFNTVLLFAIGKVLVVLQYNVYLVPCIIFNFKSKSKYCNEIFVLDKAKGGLKIFKNEDNF